MADQFKIKEEHKKRVVAFGGTGAKPLGERSQEDLEKLALIARKSNDRSLIEVFDGELPELKDLQKGEVAKQVKKAEANDDKVQPPMGPASKAAQPAGNTPSDRT